jgi:V8-like Glu-specific endopeptidase
MRGMSDTPPLSQEELVQAALEVRRHGVPAPEPTSRRFEILTALGGEPRIELEQLEAGHWQLHLTLPEADQSSVEPAAIEPVVIHREELREDPEDVLAELVPSMPDHLELSIRPQLRDLFVEEGLIRFGDLRYRPTTIFRPDGRGPYHDTSYPWGCLVRVTNQAGKQGSGVLIGPRHVLTASHCVDWTPGWAKVEVLYDGRRAALAECYATYAYAETRVTGNQIGDSESDEDYAVLVLEQRLGDRFGWMGAKTYNSSWDDEPLPWKNLGYPGDFPYSGQTPIYQGDFRLNELGADYGSARLIRSDTFDNFPGQSGGPIFGFWSDGPFVVGVVSGEGDDYNYISGGSLLPRMVNRARAGHP